MKIGSLCSGYGGLDLGLEAVLGGQVAWLCEYDKHASTILATRYPTVPNYGDLTATAWEQLEPIDWLTAGYPCQPFSNAGHRRGTDDSRHIWPHIKDAIRVLRPAGVLLENVAGHLSLGFGDVLGDLAEVGYDAQWVCVRASDIGAAHHRTRVFILAHPYVERAHGAGSKPVTARGIEPAHRSDAATDAQGIGSQGSSPAVAGNSSTVGQRTGNADRSGRDHVAAWGPYALAIRRWERVTGRTAPRPTDESGRLSPVFVEWLMGLPAGWVTDVDIPRTAQLKALGNGVVPQQAAHALRHLLAVAA